MSSLQWGSTPQLLCAPDRCSSNRATRQLSLLVPSGTILWLPLKVSVGQTYISCPSVQTDFHAFFKVQMSFHWLGPAYGMACLLCGIAGCGYVASLLYIYNSTLHVVIMTCTHTVNDNRLRHNMHYQSDNYMYMYIVDSRLTITYVHVYTCHTYTYACIYMYVHILYIHVHVHNIQVSDKLVYILLMWETYVYVQTCICTPTHTHMVMLVPRYLAGPLRRWGGSWHANGGISWPYPPNW